MPDAEGRLRQWPHELSGGLRQRVALAMALGADGHVPNGRRPAAGVLTNRQGAPLLIVADEPTTALDVSVQAQVVLLFDRLRREHGCAVLLVTHDLGVAASVADRIAVLYAGRICEIGPAANVLHHPAHPYTAQLLRARLHLDPDAPAPIAITGYPARPDASAAGLRLRAPLRAGHRGVHGGAARADAGGPRAGGGVHPSTGG